MSKLQINKTTPTSPTPLVFSELSAGEVFVYSGELWMKIERYGEAVSLEDGLLGDFDDNDLLMPANAKLDWSEVG